MADRKLKQEKIPQNGKTFIPDFLMWTNYQSQIPDEAGRLPKQQSAEEAKGKVTVTVTGRRRSHPFLHSLWTELGETYSSNTH